VSSPDKHVLCTGIAVVDQVFRVANFPRPEVKTQASEFRTVNGGNAANAAAKLAALAADPQLRRKLGDAGRKLVEEKFNLRCNVSQLVELYGA